MALNDILMLTDFQRFPSGEPCQNVYFYQRTDPLGNAVDLLAIWQTQVKASVKACQSGDFVHYLIRCVNLGDVADFTESATAGDVGALGSPIRNEFDAVNFTLRPSTRDVRPGSKRIAGIPEDDAAYTNGVITSATHLTRWNTLRVDLASTLLGADASYTPVIVKRVKVGAVYRLPQSTAELVAVPVSQVLLNNKITHQVSRGNAR